MGVLLIFGVSGFAVAQTDPILKGTDIKPFTASGSIGFKANGYTASGIQNRRAPASLQTTANLNFSLFGLSSGLNLLYSTDQSSLRQNMNNLSFNASWEWVTVQAGSVSPNFSEYGLNGTAIRGGYVSATPGNWLIELSGGQARRRVEFQSEQGFRDPAFERWTAAGKIGYSGDNNSHFYLSSHYSIDRVSDLNSGSNALEITPAENLTLTPDAQIALFDDVLTVSSQVTVSAYTRDLNSASLPIGSAGIPSFLNNIFTPRTSSRVNFAGNAAANLNLSKFGLQVGYERIQPGFRSLGIGRMRDDQEEILIAPTARLLDNRLSLQGSLTLGRDNLLGTRLQTRRNTAVGTNVQYQLTDMIMLSANYNLMVNDFSSSAEADSLQQAGLGQLQVSHTFMLQPNFTVQQGDLMHNFGVSGSYFKMDNEFKVTSNPNQNNFSSDTYSGSLNYSLSFPSGFSVNAMGNYLVYNSARTDNTTLGANAGATYSFFDNKMSMNLNLGFNQNTNELDRSSQNMADAIFKTRQMMVNLSSNYRLYEKGTLSLNLRSRTNNALEGAGTRYTELEGTINFQHRF
jgi:hypothetical protein